MHMRLSPIGRRYGWKPQLPNAQDKKNRLVRGATPVAPVINLHNFVKYVWDQGQEGSCTAHGTLGLFTSLLSLQNPPINNQVEPSRQFLYYNVTAAEGEAGQDVGGTVSGATQSMMSIGTCSEQEWPYSTPLSTTPTPEAYSNAQGSKIRQDHSIPQGLGDLLACLAAAKPFVFGFTVYPSFESDAVAQSGNAPMPTSDDLSQGSLGGHCVYCIGSNSGPTIGFSDGKQWPQNTFLCQNSWGSNWGLTALAGCFTIPFEYLTDSDLASDFWTVDVEV